MSRKQSRQNRTPTPFINDLRSELADLFNDILADVSEGVIASPEQAIKRMTERFEDPDYVKQHLRCPDCWTRDRGRGTRVSSHSVSTTLSLRVYRCNQCGGKWHLHVRNEINDGIPTTTMKVVKFIKTVEQSNASITKTAIDRSRIGSAENERTAERHGNGDENAAAGNCGADLR